MRAASRRNSSAVGRRWLVLDQDRQSGRGGSACHGQGEGTNVDRGLPILVPGSSYTQTVLPRTLQTRVEHVSSDNMDCTEGTGNMGILSDMSNADCDEPEGLIVLEQKRRRVEDTGPIQEPNPIQEPTAMHAKAVSIVASKSDHMPLYLELQPHSFVRHKGRFRFENMWLRDSMCREIMIESWSRTTGQHLLDRVERGGKAIWNWGKSFAKDFSKRLQYWRNRMEITKGRRDPRGIILYKEAQAQYIRALHHQNDYWRQRAKQFWLQSGDTNSAYFHNSVRRRRQNNRITRLRDEDGNWVDRVREAQLLLQEWQMANGGDEQLPTGPQPLPRWRREHRAILQQQRLAMESTSQGVTRDTLEQEGEHHVLNPQNDPRRAPVQNDYQEVSIDEHNHIPPQVPSPRRQGMPQQGYQPPHEDPPLVDAPQRNLPHAPPTYHHPYPPHPPYHYGYYYPPGPPPQPQVPHAEMPPPRDCEKQKYYKLRPSSVHISIVESLRNGSLRPPKMPTVDLKVLKVTTLALLRLEVNSLTSELFASRRPFLIESIKMKERLVISLMLMKEMIAFQLSRTWSGTMIDRESLRICLELLGPRVPNELNRPVYVATEATPLRL
nr:uncharacterized protein LOC109184133 isoform X2 [Ipomoea batatas]